MKKKFGCCLCLLIPLLSHGQIPDINDKNWSVDNTYSDEFSDLSKYNNGTWLWWDWDVVDPFLRSNLQCNNGILEMHTSIEPDGSYKGAYLCSKDVIPYGFFEIEMKLPVSYNHHHCFWMFAQSGGEAYEIDHIEITTDHWPNTEVRLQNQYINFNKKYKIFTTNYHHFINNDDVNQFQNHYIDEHVTSTLPLNDGFHKYAFEWTPERIIWYFNNNVIRVYESNDHVPDFPLLLKTGIGVITKEVTQVVDIPDMLEINYIHVYHLKTNPCQIDAPPVLNNSDLINFQYSLYRNIEIGNSTSNLTLNTNETFRASEDITINGEFTVPLGTELCLLPTKCH